MDGSGMNASLFAPAAPAASTRFISDNLFFTLGLLQRLTFGFTTFTYFLLLFVVGRHSPKRIGSYKWYIVINATFGYGFALYTIIFHPYPLLPHPTLVIHGVSDLFLEWIGQPPQLLIDFLVNLIVLIIAGVIYSTTCMFVYRYLQTTQSKYLRHVSDIRYYLASHAANALLHVVFVLIPLNIQLLNDGDLHSYIAAKDREAYAYLKDHVGIGFNSASGKYYVFAGMCFMLIFFFYSMVILVCTIKCYAFLHHAAHTFSAKTVQLFKSLINMLVIDLVFAAITGWVSITTTVLSFFAGLEVGSHVIFFSLIIADIYPLFNQCLVIMYVEPYRVATLQLLRLDRLLGIQKDVQWEHSVQFVYTCERLRVADETLHHPAHFARSHVKKEWKW